MFEASVKLPAYGPRIFAESPKSEGPAPAIVRKRKDGRFPRPILTRTDETFHRAMVRDANKLNRTRYKPSGVELPRAERTCPLAALLSTQAWKGAAVESEDDHTWVVRHPSGARCELRKY